jgi:DNA primase catalytic core
VTRITEFDVARLNKEISLVRVIEGAGIAVYERNGGLTARCPFHDDSGLSLSITRDTNRFCCIGCDAKGGPVEWIVKKNGVSLSHAVELLNEGLAVVAGNAPKRTRVRALPAPVAFDADEQALLNQVIGYYHETLKQSPEALDYLQRRGLSHPELIDRFKLGYANRTLGLRLPEKNRKAGSEVRGRLEKLGLYRASGHEHFNGAIVFPVTDESGNVVDVYGRKAGRGLKPSAALHLMLPEPHRGVWNLPGVMASGGEVILCQSLIDAATFWCAGFRNVTASWGVTGFTANHLGMFKRYGVKRVLIAFGRDDAGEAAAAKLADHLIVEGIACYRIEFPKGLDANAYAIKMPPASKSLGVLIRKALWLGEGKAPAPLSVPVDELEAVLSQPLEEPPILQPDPNIDLAFVTEHVPEDWHHPDEELTELPATPLPSGPVDDPVLKKTPEELVLMQGDRQYRVRGWMKPLNPESMKINLLVHRPASLDGRFHVDTFDLYNAKARASFLKQAGIELGESEAVLKHDLGRVLLKLEALQDAELVSALKKIDKPALTEEEREEALALLKDPKLVQRIQEDFAASGIVGEETNMLVGYLACVSRLLDHPLAMIIQSSSAAGKSSLMDALLNLMPNQAQMRFSAMTGQSLFYMGETDLKHRILAIAEEEGAQSAEYALKLLQSDGAVTIASTGKDPASGLLVTREYRVEGPVMLFLTTTAIDIDEELLNRCLVLTVNESREQTRAIHTLQRKRQTLEGLLQDEDRKAVAKLHRNAQGILDQLHVVNPYADRLTFLDDKTRTRRDHMKYLTLINTIALLHQYQRPIRSIEHRGRVLRYVEVMASDILLANKLAHEVLGRTLDELPPQTRALLGIVHEWVKVECAKRAISRADLRFTRREVRMLTGWGDTQLKVHLARLAELEYLTIYRTKAGFQYELLYGGEGADGTSFLMGLSEPVCVRSGLSTVRSEVGRSAVAASSGGGHAEECEITPCEDADFDHDLENQTNPLVRTEAVAASYTYTMSEGNGA